MPRRPDVPCAGNCGRFLWRGTGSSPTPKCRPCRREARGCLTPNVKGKCKCDGCVSADREANRNNAARASAAYLAKHGEHYSTAHRRKNGRKQHPRKECGWCGAVHPLKEDGFTLDIEGLAHAQWFRHYGKASESREMVRFTPGPILTATETCAECGEAFRFAVMGLKRTYCSTSCRNRSAWRRRYAARGEFAISTARRLAIYERDNWTCGICGEPTSRVYTSTDPWSPTLDHIEPQSHALIPDHSDVNLRASHSLCNSMRSDNRKTDDLVRLAVLPMLYQAFTL